MGRKQKRLDGVGGAAVRCAFFWGQALGWAELLLLPELISWDRARAEACAPAGQSGAPTRLRPRPASPHPRFTFKV